jgi:preprotein translocase subunit SecD
MQPNHRRNRGVAILVLIIFIVAGGLWLTKGLWRLPRMFTARYSLHSYTVKIDLRANAWTESPNDMDDMLDQADVKFQARIRTIGAKVKDSHIDVDKGLISYTITDVENVANLRWLLAQQGIMEICHTWDMAEVMPYLEKADTLLTIVMAQKELEQLKDSGSASVGDQLFGEGDTAKQLQGLINSGLQARARFGNRFFFNSQAPLPGLSCQVGTAYGSDTAAIDHYLEREDVKKLFPPGLRFLWSLDEIVKGNNAFVLYAVAEPVSGETITGDMILEAKSGYDAMGIPEVSMTLNPPGTLLFEKMSRQAAHASVMGQSVKKCLAILMDGKVYSAPRVQQVITAGKIEMTGIDNMAQAENQAAIMNNGALPVTFTQENIIVSTGWGLHNKRH